MPAENARIEAICRYPVKGLSDDPLARTRLEPGKTIACDRLYAIENGPSGFDAAAPAYLPKMRFLMLMRNERLASLKAEFNTADHRLVIRRNGMVAADGRLDTEAGRRAIESFFDRFSAGELRGPPRVLSAAGHSFSDSARKVVSLINLESVRHIEGRIGAAVHPLRFRANVYVDGLPAWSEFEWIGKRVAAGGLILEGLSRIERCAATNVDPETARRDLTIPASLLQAYGHSDCGIYLKVVEGGEVSVGDAIGLA